VSDHWLPVSPVTGELDAFRWKQPTEVVTLPALEPRRGLIAGPADADEPDEALDAPPDRTPPTTFAPEAPPPPENRPAPEARAPEAPSPESRPPDGRAAADGQPAADPVIPLVHAPDDPGPEAGPPAEPEPDAPRRRSFFRP